MKTIDSDVNFMNFEDPEVFERFTGPDYEKSWKATYGFDKVVKAQAVPTKFSNGTTAYYYDGTQFDQYCAESENR